MKAVKIKRETISSIDYTKEKLEGEYTKICFDHCDFSEVAFGDIQFEDCQFIACNLSLCKSYGTSWSNVSFDGCKMTGINFSNANRFTYRAGFKDCQLQYASFHALNLQGTLFDKCQLEEVDFTGCILKKAVFNECELVRAEFSQCNLEYADFVTARGYLINPSENRISHARFSRYGLAGLLTTFRIEIV